MDIMGRNFSRNSQISIIIYPNGEEVFQEEECLGTIIYYVITFRGEAHDKNKFTKTFTPTDILHIFTKF